MRFALALLISLHAVLHILGAAKGLRWIELTQLRTPIGATAGWLWLLTAVLLLAGAAGVALGARWWWYPALPGIVLSQALIVSAWSDAKFGTVANVAIAVPLLIAAMASRATSFRSRFEHDRDRLLANVTRPAAVVTEADVAQVPPLMRSYLRAGGAVGRARVRNMRVTFTAEMRGSSTAPWMTSTATQYEFFDPPARLFHMSASRSGIPLDVLHEYIGDSATFQVRIAGLYPMIDTRGDAITHDETVTLMNDILVMAPAAVLDLPFTFETTGEHTLGATFRNGGYTVAASLTFSPAGDLVGFTSADRAHGREAGPAIWSTPISDYRTIDGIRVGSRGDANWIDATGEWTYGRFRITSIAYNVGK